MSKIYYHDDHFTIRVIDTHLGEVSPEACDVVLQTAGKVFFDRKLPGHLFISIIAAEALNTGSGEDGFGFGLYHSGIQNVALAGLKPDVDGLTHEHWLQELGMSTAHEIVHYEQDLNGTLYSSEECEMEAERLAMELCGVDPASYGAEGQL